ASLGNNPSLTSPAPWVAATTYAINNQVAAADGFTYTSLSNGNLGNNPVTDAGVHWSQGSLTAWSTTITGNASSNQFVGLTTALTDAQIFYPLGAGPASQSFTRNVF